MNQSNTRDTSPANEDLARKLKILMLLRVIFVTLLLGASLFIQARAIQIRPTLVQTPHYFIMGGIYFITIIYLILFRLSLSMTVLAYVQVLGDTFIVTAIIFATGGIESTFSFLYILNTITGGIILYRRGGVLVASLSAILYGLVIDLHFYGVIRPLGLQDTSPVQYQPFYALYLIIIHMAAFYLVALLSSYLSEQVRKSATALRAKEIDFDRLESLHESIIRSMSSGLMVLDAQGNVVLSNPAALTLLTPRDSYGNRDISEQYRHFLGACFPSQTIISRYEDISRSSGRELIYERSDGSNIHLRLTVSPLVPPMGGDKKGHILIFQDVTELKRIEEAMKRFEGLAMIGELAAGIAHEIKNPLASISGSVQVLRERMGGERMGKKLMDIVVREIERLNNLVNDFLFFARPKNISWQSFDLNSKIKDSLDLFKNASNWKGDVEIIADLSPSLKITSDPALVGQILWNLFLNASEAMGESGTLYVSAGPEDLGITEGPPAAKIIIRDTGPGFSEKALQHLFVPFFTTKEKGSGLGLAIVKRLVEELMGEVKGRNHPEGGAEITLLLPFSVIPLEVAPPAPIHLRISREAGL
ncbi:MAG: PAS domain-containing protein [Desulfobacteraceae bacterium]|nr:MAG: PAS domain-containing protein [Desulfobacteraceae bacterium]